MGDGKAVSARVRKDNARVGVCGGGVSPACLSPYVLYEPKSLFVRADGPACDLEDSTPFIEDEVGLVHKGSFGVFVGEVCDDDFSIIDKGDGGGGGKEVGDGGGECCAHIVFLDDGEQDGTYAYPEHWAEAAALGGALKERDARAEAISCTQTGLN